jgi:hypothetical protein
LLESCDERGVAVPSGSEPGRDFFGKSSAAEVDENTKREALAAMRQEIADRQAARQREDADAAAGRSGKRTFYAGAIEHVSGLDSIKTFFGVCLVVAFVLGLKFGLPIVTRDLPGCESSKVMQMLEGIIRDALAKNGQADRTALIKNPERRSNNTEMQECKSVAQIDGYADTPIHYEVSWDSRVAGRILVRMRPAN